MMNTAFLFEILPFLIAVVVVLLLIVVAIIAAVVISNKNKQSRMYNVSGAGYNGAPVPPKKPAPAAHVPPASTVPPAAHMRPATQVPTASPVTPAASATPMASAGTEVLGAGGNAGIPSGGARTIKIRLQDIQDAMRTYEYPIRGRVLIGKNPAKCQIVVDYNKYISAVHCEIVSTEAGFVVRDGADPSVASTNGTFVNNVKVAPAALLPAGAVLRLGEVSFRVTYI